MPAPQPRFDELAVFVQVAEAGSLAAAARRLGVPKSTIGRALTRLEAELGVVLLRRMARGPSLTEAGRALFTRAAPHIAALRDAAASLTGGPDEIHGALRVTAPVDLAQLVLGPLAASFLTRHPGVSLEVDASIRVVDLVGEGFDLALRVSQRALAPSALVARRLGRLDLGLYASPTYLARQGTPSRAEELQAHEHVLLLAQRGRARLTVEGPRGTTRIEARGRVSANDFAFLREALAGGLGIGALPWFVAREELASGRLVRVLPDHRLAGNTVFLVHAPGKPLPRKLQAFRDHLLAHAPRMLGGAP